MYICVMYTCEIYICVIIHLQVRIWWGDESLSPFRTVVSSERFQCFGLLYILS